MARRKKSYDGDSGQSTLDDIHTTDSRGPVQKFHIGKVTTAIFRAKGQYGEFYNVIINNGYKDKSGNWKDSKSLTHQETLSVITLLQYANRWMLEHPIVNPSSVWVPEPNVVDADQAF